MCFAWKGFRENIGGVRGGWNIKNIEATIGDLFTNMMIVNVHMFHASMKLAILAERDSRLIVASEYDRTLAINL
jgi:hypothetical protein